ncbi:hypothetical protein [Streptomyces benahoarensis]|uniref:hypothetical protein n=1 Tax=Streptomyces benahoarensis TaxID=2595054 RepID=UPI002035D441|nr:hypothetical protein [Streptomyces benahoarensis]
MTRAAARARLHRAAAAVLVLGAVLLPYAPPAAAAPPGGAPTAEVGTGQAGTGGTVTVSGRGWRPKALLTLLICGQNMIGGTNSCANGDGRAVTTDGRGAFRTALPVAEPPKPCPCVVHVATVTGPAAADDVPFAVAGHPVAPLPKQETGARLAVVSAPELTGGANLLTWFGAPPRRRLAFTVGNTGPVPAKNPVFRVGTAHGVFAPQWEDRQWRGTVPAGKKARIALDVELAAGAYGDYQVSATYGGTLLVEQPWGVGRPWGVTLFWVLLCLVVPAAVFRVGMAVVDRVRPRTAPVPRAAAPAHGAAGPRAPGRWRARLRPLRGGADGGTAPADRPAALPWYTPDTAPSATTSTAPPTAEGSS